MYNVQCRAVNFDNYNSTESFFKYPTCSLTTTYSNYFNFCPRSMESKRKSAIKLEFKCVGDGDLSTAGPPQMYGIK